MVLLDETILERLRRLGGDSLIDELGRIFLSDAPVRLERARDALLAGDREALRHEVHALKGSALNLGALALQQCAAVAESLALSGPYEQVRVALEQVSREVSLLSLELETMVGSGGKPLLAVVEDNSDNRLLLRILLRDRFELVEYADGIAALEGLRRRVPALVILDIALPGMDGTEVLREMQRDAVLAGVPALALTAHASAGDRDRLLAAGFADYVAKPILDEAELLKVIEHVLARSLGR